MEGVQEAMTTRNLEADQWRNRGEWRLVSGRRGQLLNKLNRQTDRHRQTQTDRQTDRQIDGWMDGRMDGWMDGWMDR